MTAKNVAVVIPVFNGEPTVAKAVLSALGQAEVAEVVVVDDGSKDLSAQAALECDDGSGRLSIVRQPNRGPSAAYNTGIDRSRSELVCRLDADDYFLPDRFTNMFRCAGDDWDLVADKIAVRHAEGGPREQSIADGLDGSLSFERFVLGNVGNPRKPRSELGYLQPVIRRSFLLAHGLRNDETVRFGEDFILFAAALALGARFRVVDCCGYVAVSRAESLSHTHTAQDLRALLAAEQSLARRHLRSGERGALRRHMRHVQDKYQYRLALDAKQSGNLLEAMKLALSDWHALGFMCLETARAKARAIVGDGGDVAPRSTFAS